MYKVGHFVTARMQGFRILTGLRTNVAALVLDQRAPRRQIEPGQQRFPCTVQSLVVFGQIGIGANFFVARGLRTCAIEGRCDETGVSFLSRRDSRVGGPAGEVACGELANKFATGQVAISRILAVDNDPKRLALTSDSEC